MSSHLRPFGMISTSLWQSEKFQTVKNLDTRLAYIWLHTSQKTCAGVLRIGAAHLYEEIDFVESIEDAEDIFLQLSNAGLIEWCKPYVIIGNYLRFNPVKSYRHAIGAFNEVLALPDGEPKQKLFALLQKQKGARDLAKWRDKAGEPHRVIFAMNDYIVGLEDEVDFDGNNQDCLNPSETPYEPLMNPSGKSRSKSINEKGESITLPSSENVGDQSPTDDQELKFAGLRTKGAKPKRPPTHASKEAKNSPLARGIAQ
jgi:hypothetical protein